MRITYDYNTGNMSIDEEPGLDVEASLAAFEKQVKEEIQQEFPDAEVTITRHNAEGWERGVQVEDGAIDDKWFIEDVIADVYQEFEWLVYEK